MWGQAGLKQFGDRDTHSYVLVCVAGAWVCVGGCAGACGVRGSSQICVGGGESPPGKPRTAPLKDTHACMQNGANRLTLFKHLPKVRADACSSLCDILAVPRRVPTL